MVRFRPVTFRETIIAPARVGIVLVVLAAAAWAGFVIYDRAQLSPFVTERVRIGMLVTEHARPGLPIQAVKDDYFRELGRQIGCRDFGDDIRLCGVLTDEPLGYVKMLVDDDGRIALVQLLVRDTSLTWIIDRVQERSAQWSRVQSTPSTYQSPTGPVTRWETANGRWSAEIGRREPVDRPVEMRVTDLHRLARIAERNPATLMVLATEGVVRGPDLAAIKK